MTAFALDMFSITRHKPAPKLREYRVTWPCGSTWNINRLDLDVPEYENGEQNGITHCFDTLKEAREHLPGYGATVELLK